MNFPIGYEKVGIYAICNKINLKIYIGSSKNLYKRDKQQSI